MGYNNKNLGLKFQAYQTEGLEGYGLNIPKIKQAQTMNIIVEGIFRQGGNTSINLIKSQI